MQNTLLDNSSDALSMLGALRTIIADERCTRLMIATGYWDLPGTALLLDALTTFLQRPGAQLQLLIGVDPVVRTSQQREPKYSDCHNTADYIRTDLMQLDVRSEYQDTVELLQHYCQPDFDGSPLQIKRYEHTPEGDTRFMHAKCYIATGNDVACGIIGSSNLTKKGLTGSGNLELNYLDTTPYVVTYEGTMPGVKGHIQWFNELWQQAEEWNREFLEEVLPGTPNVAPRTVHLTPYEVYIRLLQEQYGDTIDADTAGRTATFLQGTHYRLLDFQAQAVAQCLSTMHHHGGFMLADVVGLGKTVVGALVIKHFLTTPDTDGRLPQVLIITPPAIQQGWRDIIAELDHAADSKIAPAITYATTGSITQLVDNDDDSDDDGAQFEGGIPDADYGLIIIDESHRFRNPNTKMRKQLDELIDQVCARTGCYPYVGLLSATPQNNSPRDLQSQIYLFERNVEDSTLRKACNGNLKRFFADIKKRYDALLAPPAPHDVAQASACDTHDNTPQRFLDAPQRTLTPEQLQQCKEGLKALGAEIRDAVLADILIRRTRTDIRKYYTDFDLHFPSIEGPRKLEYKLTDALALRFHHTVDAIAFQAGDEPNPDALSYWRYRALECLANEDDKQRYATPGLSASKMSRQLAAIMRNSLIKRLESSFDAFRESLANLKQYTANMIYMCDEDQVFICPDINVNDVFRKAGSDKQLALQQLHIKLQRLNDTGRNENERNHCYHYSDFLPEYRDFLQHDYDALDRLCTMWQSSADPKLDVFKRDLMPVLMNPDNNPQQKLVIFTEAIATAAAIKEAIATTAPSLRVLKITADNRDKKAAVIAANFDANLPEDKQRNDYDVIITTEVLAEGINLHRANTILNYDTPWNSTRLMQRIGRVNRIGSKADKVFVYNFMPTAESDEVIGLIQRAFSKMQAFHALFGGDNAAFIDAEDVDHHIDIRQQFEGEETPGEQFIELLKQYRQQQPQRYRHIADAPTPLLTATSATTPGADAPFFLIKTGNGSKHYITFNTQGQPDIIAPIEMATKCQCQPDAPELTIPHNATELQQQAERRAMQAMMKAATRTNDERREKAVGAINQINQAGTLSDEAKQCLHMAYRPVKQGNTAMIRAIITLAKRVEQSHRELIPLADEELSQLIVDKLDNITRQATVQHGQASTIIAFYNL